jgi:hypothetical protein
MTLQDSGNEGTPLGSAPNSKEQVQHRPTGPGPSPKSLATHAARATGSHRTHPLPSRIPPRGPTFAQVTDPNFSARNPVGSFRYQLRSTPAPEASVHPMDALGETPSGLDPQMLATGNGLGNPYFNESELGAQLPLSEASLQRIFQKLPAPPLSLPPGRVLRHFQVNPVRLGRQEQELLTVGVVLFTPGFNPQLEYLEGWANKVLAVDLGIQIKQVRLLAASTFLLILDSPESRAKLLATTPISIESKYVLIIPYTEELDLQALQYKNTAVWVDIVDLDPVLEVEANRMLESIGPVLHSTVRVSRSRFCNIRGCVLVDLTQDLTHGLMIVDPEGNEEGWVPVLYRNLPKICQRCRGVGHLPMNCPHSNARTLGEPKRHRGARPHSPGATPVDPAGQQPFTEVVRGKGHWARAPPSPQPVSPAACSPLSPRAFAKEFEAMEEMEIQEQLQHTTIQDVSMEPVVPPSTTWELPGSPNQDMDSSEDPDYIAEPSTESTTAESLDPEEESTAESEHTPKSNIFATGIQQSQCSNHGIHNLTPPQLRVQPQKRGELDNFSSPHSTAPRGGASANLNCGRAVSQIPGEMVQQPADPSAVSTQGAGPSPIAHTLAEVHLARLQAGERVQNRSSPSQPQAEPSSEWPHSESPRTREVKRTPPVTRLGVAFKSPKGNATRPALQLLRANVPKGAKNPPSINSIKGKARKSSVQGDRMQVIHE